MVYHLLYRLAHVKTTGRVIFLYVTFRISCGQELYDAYCGDYDRLHQNGEKGASLSYFNSVWREERPLLKVTSRGVFMACDVCTDINEGLHGTPGIQATRNSEERARLKKRQEEHHRVRH